MFASLIHELRLLTSQDPNLDQLMKDYEDAVRDLRFGSSDGRIKTCISKQFMLLEGIGAVDPNTTKTTLGGMCEELTSWPHATLKEALKKLYGFASDYPGIRHGSRAQGALRPIEMRDMVAMSILLTGFTPYLERRLSADAIYGGSTMNAMSAPAVLPLTIPDSGNSGEEQSGTWVLRATSGSRFWREGVSQFAFLQREWASVFEAASKAEAAVRADPRTACFYARRTLELAVKLGLQARRGAPAALSGQPLGADPRTELQAGRRRGGVQQGAGDHHARQSRRSQPPRRAGG